MSSATRPQQTPVPSAPRRRGRPPKVAPLASENACVHGSLPEALLAAAERVLKRDGVGGLGLRAIAREAGVSHTAPKHHFGDTSAMLSQLAAAGFERLRAAMSSALEVEAGTSGRRHAIGAAYLRFAYDNPELFSLMFRNEIVDVKHPALAEASGAAMRVMAGAIDDEAESATSGPRQLSAEQATRATSAWAYAHGLATLLIDGRLRGILKSTDAFDDPLELAYAALKSRQG